MHYYGRAKAPALTLVRMVDELRRSEKRAPLCCARAAGARKDFPGFLFTALKGRSSTQHDAEASCATSGAD
jgi:hypothetical protein